MYVLPGIRQAPLISQKALLCHAVFSGLSISFSGGLGRWPAGGTSWGVACVVCQWRRGEPDTEMPGYPQARLFPHIYHGRGAARHAADLSVLRTTLGGEGRDKVDDNTGTRGPET